MNFSVLLFSDLFALSICIWLLYGFYITLRVRLFIVKRYEQDTDLSQTKYFSEMMPWLKYAPPAIRSATYGSHLLKFLRYEKKDRFAIAKKKGKGQITFYDDIKHPQQVTSHFTKKEIRQAKRSAYALTIICLHGILYWIFRIIWPEIFISS